MNNICVICVHSGMVIFCTLQMKSFNKYNPKCVCCVVSSYLPSSYLLWAVKLCCVTTPPPGGSVLKVKVNDAHPSLGFSTESSSDQVEGEEQNYYNNASTVSDVNQSKVSGLRQPMRAGAPVSMLACRRACGLYINRWIGTDYTDTSYLLRRPTLHTPAPGKHIGPIFYFHELPFIHMFWCKSYWLNKPYQM